MEKNPEYQPLAQKILEGKPFDEAMRELQIPGEQAKAAKDAVLKILADRQTDELLLHSIAIEGIREGAKALQRIAEGKTKASVIAAKALFEGAVRLKSGIRGSTAPLPENAQKDIFAIAGEIEIKGPWKLKDPGV